MQTLDLSSTTPQSENRLKRLFWPSIKTANDVDDLGMQGYWVCTAISVFVLISSWLAGHSIAGVFAMLLYYVGGVGVRERSRYAAAVVFGAFALDTLAQPGILKVFLSALLLSNLRATWIAWNWKSTAEAAMPMRFTETWTDKFVDQLPIWLWPKIRIPYYIFSACFLALFLVGLAVILLRSRS